jgi:hypothetical protein
VTALSPAASLSPREAEDEWQGALRDLRRDGARAREVRLARPARGRPR